MAIVLNEYSPIGVSDADNYGERIINTTLPARKDTVIGGLYNHDKKKFSPSRRYFLPGTSVDVYYENDFEKLLSAPSWPYFSAYSYKMDMKYSDGTYKPVPGMYTSIYGYISLDDAMDLIFSDNGIYYKFDGKFSSGRKSMPNQGVWNTLRYQGTDEQKRQYIIDNFCESEWNDDMSSIPIIRLFDIDQKDCPGMIMSNGLKSNLKISSGQDTQYYIAVYGRRNYSNNFTSCDTDHIFRTFIKPYGDVVTPPTKIGSRPITLESLGFEHYDGYDIGDCRLEFEFAGWSTDESIINTRTLDFDSVYSGTISPNEDGESFFYPSIVCKYPVMFYVDGSPINETYLTPDTEDSKGNKLTNRHEFFDEGYSDGYVHISKNSAYTPPTPEFEKDGGYGKRFYGWYTDPGFNNEFDGTMPYKYTGVIENLDTVEPFRLYAKTKDFCTIDIITNNEEATINIDTSLASPPSGIDDTNFLVRLSENKVAVLQGTEIQKDFVTGSCKKESYYIPYTANKLNEDFMDYTDHNHNKMYYSITEDSVINLVWGRTFYCPSFRLDMEGISGVEYSVAESYNGYTIGKRNVDNKDIYYFKNTYNSIEVDFKDIVSVSRQGYAVRDYKSNNTLGDKIEGSKFKLYLNIYEYGALALGFDWVATKNIKITFSTDIFGDTTNYYPMIECDYTDAQGNKATAYNYDPGTDTYFDVIDIETAEDIEPSNIRYSWDNGIDQYNCEGVSKDGDTLYIKFVPWTYNVVFNYDDSSKMSVKADINPAITVSQYLYSMFKNSGVVVRTCANVGTIENTQFACVEITEPDSSSTYRFYNSDGSMINSVQRSDPTDKSDYNIYVKFRHDYGRLFKDKVDTIELEDNFYNRHITVEGYDLDVYKNSTYDNYLNVKNNKVFADETNGEFEDERLNNSMFTSSNIQYVDKTNNTNYYAYTDKSCLLICAYPYISGKLDLELNGALSIFRVDEYAGNASYCTFSGDTSLAESYYYTSDKRVRNYYVKSLPSRTSLKFMLPDFKSDNKLIGYPYSEEYDFSDRGSVCDSPKYEFVCTGSTHTSIRKYCYGNYNSIVLNDGDIINITFSYSQINEWGQASTYNDLTQSFIRLFAKINNNNVAAFIDGTTASSTPSEIVEYMDIPIYYGGEPVDVGSNVMCTAGGTMSFVYHPVSGKPALSIIGNDTGRLYLRTENVYEGIRLDSANRMRVTEYKWADLFMYKDKTVRNYKIKIPDGDYYNLIGTSVSRSDPESTNARTPMVLTDRNYSNTIPVRFTYKSVLGTRYWLSGHSNGYDNWRSTSITLTTSDFINYVNNYSVKIYPILDLNISYKTLPGTGSCLNMLYGINIVGDNITIDESVTPKHIAAYLESNSIKSDYVSLVNDFNSTDGSLYSVGSNGVLSLSSNLNLSGDPVTATINGMAVYNIAPFVPRTINRFNRSVDEPRGLMIYNKSRSSSSMRYIYTNSPDLRVSSSLISRYGLTDYPYDSRYKIFGTEPSPIGGYGEETMAYQVRRGDRYYLCVPKSVYTPNLFVSPNGQIYFKLYMGENMVATY